MFYGWVVLVKRCGRESKRFNPWRMRLAPCGKSIAPWREPAPSWREIVASWWEIPTFRRRMVARGCGRLAPGASGSLLGVRSALHGATVRLPEAAVCHRCAAMGLLSGLIALRKAALCETGADRSPTCAESCPLFLLSTLQRSDAFGVFVVMEKLGFISGVGRSRASRAF